MQFLSTRLLHRFINKKTIGCRTYCLTRIVDAGQPTAVSHPELLKEGEMTPGITCDEYIIRREKLLKLLPEKSIAIIAAAPVKMMNDVVPYPYRQDADYLYITGCQQPGGVAVLGHEIGLCMFMPEPTTHDVTWEGNTAGVKEALEIFKADQALPMSKLRQMLPGILGGSSEVFHKPETATKTYVELESFLNTLSKGKVKDLKTFTHELRWLKSPAEINLMREAASIAC